MCAKGYLRGLVKKKTEETNNFAQKCEFIFLKGCEVETMFFLKVQQTKYKCFNVQLNGLPHCRKYFLLSWVQRVPTRVIILTIITKHNTKKAQYNYLEALGYRYHQCHHCTISICSVYTQHTLNTNYEHVYTIEI